MLLMELQLNKMVIKSSSYMSPLLLLLLLAL
nr:MAG TPA: hypothetical protein [Caudoviricetes sp.]